MAADGPKGKRRNSEKRKEKSRDAARHRRSKESDIFSDLIEILPLPHSVRSQLDKASIMRLCIAYLKLRKLLVNDEESDNGADIVPDLENSFSFDSFLPKALEGFLVVLTSDGDIVYITESVNHHLGLPQIDMIGHSIYDFSHPCDHDEIRDMLNIRSDEADFSVFLRFKSNLVCKSRSTQLKSSTYKVINCAGHITHPSGDSVVRSREDLRVEKVSNHYLVLVGEPIPHPSNIEIPLDGFTFLTKHGLDMKYTYVDDNISQFLGYNAEDLITKSAYEFHHMQDHEAVLKSYKTLLAKGQIVTPNYRFLARNGGYAWVKTQASVVYGSRDSRPQAVVCVHMVLSAVEEEDVILSALQASATVSSLVESNYCHLPPRGLETTLSSLALPVLQETSDLAVDSLSPAESLRSIPTDDDENLCFDVIVADITKVEDFAENNEDLLYLAPDTGDTCVPLEMHSNLLELNTFLLDDFKMPPDLMECFPLTPMRLLDSNATADLVLPVRCVLDEEPCKGRTTNVTARSFKEDPFLFSDAHLGQFTSPCKQSMPNCKFDQLFADVSSPISNSPPQIDESEEEMMPDLGSPISAVQSPSIASNGYVTTSPNYTDSDDYDSVNCRGKVGSGSSWQMPTRRSIQAEKIGFVGEEDSSDQFFFTSVDEKGGLSVLDDVIQIDLETVAPQNVNTPTHFFQATDSPQKEVNISNIPPKAPSVRAPLLEELLFESDNRGKKRCHAQEVPAANEKKFKSVPAVTANSSLLRLLSTPGRTTNGTALCKDKIVAPPKTYRQSNRRVPVVSPANPKTTVDDAMRKNGPKNSLVFSAKQQAPSENGRLDSRPDYRRAQPMETVNHQQVLASSNSILENLLVSGCDLREGYCVNNKMDNVHKRDEPDLLPGKGLGLPSALLSSNNRKETAVPPFPVEIRLPKPVTTARQLTAGDFGGTVLTFEVPFCDVDPDEILAVSELQDEDLLRMLDVSLGDSFVGSAELLL